MYVFVCMCLYVCLCVCVCMYVCMYVFVCMFVCICLYVCFYVCVCMYMFVCTCLYVCLYVCFCMYVFICMCLYVCVFPLPSPVKDFLYQSHFTTICQVFPPFKPKVLTVLSVRQNREFQEYSKAKQNKACVPVMQCLVLHNVGLLYFCKELTTKLQILWTFNRHRSALRVKLLSAC